MDREVTVLLHCYLADGCQLLTWCALSRTRYMR